MNDGLLQTASATPGRRRELERGRDLVQHVGYAARREPGFAREAIVADRYDSDEGNDFHSVVVHCPQTVARGGRGNPERRRLPEPVNDCLLQAPIAASDLGAGVDASKDLIDARHRNPRLVGDALGAECRASESARDEWGFS